MAGLYTSYNSIKYLRKRDQCLVWRHEDDKLASMANRPTAVCPSSSHIQPGNRYLHSNSSIYLFVTLFRLEPSVTIDDMKYGTAARARKRQIIESFEPASPEPASPVRAQQGRPGWLAEPPSPKIIMDPSSSSRHTSHGLSHDLRGSHSTLLTIDSDSSGTARSMSDFLPITKTPKKLFFRRQASENKTLIDDSDGNNIAYIDYSDGKEGKRYLKNAMGFTCAIIIRQ